MITISICLQKTFEISQTEIKINMLSLSDTPIIIPPTFKGKWRFNFVGKFKDEGDKMECMRIYFDLVDTIKI